MFALLITIALSTIAFGLPVIKPALIPATAPFTQTCTTELPRGGTWILFTVNIGVMFANGAGCGGIYRTLVTQIGSSPEAFEKCGLNTVGVKGGKPVCDYSCVEADGGESTLLSFQTFLGQGDDVNTALTAMYPMVPGGFDCPNIYN